MVDARRRPGRPRSPRPARGSPAARSRPACRRSRSRRCRRRTATSSTHSGRRVVIERAIAERLPSGAITTRRTPSSAASARAQRLQALGLDPVVVGQQHVAASRLQHMGRAPVSRVAVSYSVGHAAPAPARARATVGPPRARGRPSQQRRELLERCARPRRRRASCRRARGSCGAGTCPPRSRTRAARRAPRQSRARARRSSKPRVLGLGRRERGEVVRAAQRRAQRAARRGRSPGPPERAAALEQRARRAARARGSSRSCCVASRRASKPAGAGSAASTATSSSSSPLRRSGSTASWRVARDLPPRVHAASVRPATVSVSGRRRGRARRGPCAARARAPPARSAAPGWRAQPANVRAVVLDRELGDHRRHGRRRRVRHAPWRQPPDRLRRAR